MTDACVAAVASLAGVTVGAITTYLTQERQWRRTTRRDLYADYVGKSNICHEELMNVRSTIKRKVTENGNPNRWEGDLKTQWDTANKRMAETSALNDQLSLIATVATLRAAADLESHLRDLKAELDR